MTASFARKASGNADSFRWFLVVCGVWLLMQAWFWRLPPHGDALGHIFPQAGMLLAHPFDLNAIATMRAAEHPPFISWLVMAGWKIFGVNVVWPHLVSSLMGLLAIVGAYRLARHFFRPADAATIATLLALNWVFFAQSSNPYLEIPVVAGLAWSLASLVRRQRVAVTCWVAFMTLSKETSFPLLMPMFLFALWQASDWRRPATWDWKTALAVCVGALPALGWVAFVALNSGAFLGNSITAAMTNDAIPRTPLALARKLALGPVQLLVMGLWIPVAALAWRRAQTRASGDDASAHAMSRAQLFLLLGVAGMLIVVHALVSIGLNRYYLPILPVALILVWRVLQPTPALRAALVIATVGWSAFCYFQGIRYAATEDTFAAVKYLEGHRDIDRALERMGAGGVVLTAYPTSFELVHPSARYVERRYETLDILAVTDADLPHVGWAIVGVQGFYDQVLPRLTHRKVTEVMRRGEGVGLIVLYRIE